MAIRLFEHSDKTISLSIQERLSMKRLRLLILLGFLSAITPMVEFSFGGVTGKISGTVHDAETGDPLPGANVFILGTTLGASTDLDGFFTILNVPPGFHEVTASMVGYRDVTIKEVRVIIDQTTRLEYRLQSEFLEGEAVIIIAERKVVKKDVATSTASFNATEISAIPLNNVSDVVGLQAGVENGLVIRGGAAAQTLFQLDGITMRDPRNNQPITAVALSSLQEVAVERGGFNAEYGQVQSGIVKVVTREGDKSSYNINFISRYSPPAAKHFGISPFDPQATMLRPYLDDEVCWTGTKNGVWDKYTQRQYPEFSGWNEVSRQLLTDSDPENDLTPAAAQQLFKWQHRRQEINDQGDYYIDASLGGPVPYLSRKLGNLRFITSYRSEREMLLVPLSRPDYKDYYWSLKLNSDIRPTMKLSLSAMLGKSYHVAQNEAGLNLSTEYIRSTEQVAGQIANLYVPRSTDSRLFSNAYFSTGAVQFRSYAIKLTHVINPTTFYDVSLDHIYRAYDIKPIRLRNMDKNIEFAPGKYTNESPFGFSPQHDPGIDGMMTGGHTSTARDFSAISGTTLKFDFSSQINPYNLIKAGFEFAYNDLNLDYGEVKEIYIDGNVYVKMRKNPLRGALYLQDKLELMGLIVNAGLRLDYSDANTLWPKIGTWDKDFYSSNFSEDQEFDDARAKAELTLSPRLSISHPITENAKLFFNYGHFKQLPTYEQMFRLSRGGSNEVQGIGDPNLQAEKTIAYELGYDQALYDDYLIQLALFYKDITNQRDYTLYISADASINYLRATNNLYQDVRGFELTLRRPAGTWWLGFVNYTYQVSTLGHFGKAEIYQDPKLQRDYDRNTRAMYQERPIPQPYARALLSFFSPSRFGYEFFGFYPFSDWNVNLLADWREGPWLTWNPSRKLNVAQNVQARDWYNLDLRFMKSFRYKNLSLSFFMDVYNALNIKRLSLNSFYDYFDYQYYFESLHLPESADYDNIPGKDKVGDYRKRGVAFQPIEKVGSISTISAAEINERVIYYDVMNKKYYDYKNGSWSEVEGKRLDKILSDKAYIDMPNHTYFNFLNPRQIFFGINLSFQL